MSDYNDMYEHYKNILLTGECTGQSYITFFDRMIQSAVAMLDEKIEAIENAKRTN